MYTTEVHGLFKFAKKKSVQLRISGIKNFKALQIRHENVFLKNSHLGA